MNGWLDNPASAGNPLEQQTVQLTLGGKSMGNPKIWACLLVAAVVLYFVLKRK